MPKSDADSRIESRPGRRFSLWWLVGVLLMVILLGVGLVMHRVRQVNRAVAELNDAGFIVWFNSSHSILGDHSRALGKDIAQAFFSERCTILVRSGPTPLWNTTVRPLEGSDDAKLIASRDAFRRLPPVIGASFPNTELTNEGVAILAEFPQLKYLTLSAPFPKCGVTIVDFGLMTTIDTGFTAGFTADKPSITVGMSLITDRACLSLAKSTTLERLTLDCTCIGGAGLRALAGIPTLKVLSVRHTNVTPADLAEFRRLRPDVRLNEGP